MAHNGLSRKKQITSFLKEAGFDGVGVAPADPLGVEASHLQKWIASGFVGPLDYLKKNLATRCDPRKFLPGARSVIVVGKAYCLPEKPLGPVAAYALHQDYHEVFHAVLEKAVEKLISMERGSSCRIAIDTSPVFERALASRAGLGWVGFSTNLVIPRYGPRVLLGAIVTNLALEPDAPFAGDFCSDCRRCIEACPNGALVAPYRLDARRCISCLTIEKKGPFHAWESEAIKGWAFGCDHCTRACSDALSEKNAQPSLGLLRPNMNLWDRDLEGLLDLCEKGFKRSFGGTPLSRCGRSRLVRNILTAAKNLGLPWVAARARRHLTGGTLASQEAARRALGKRQ